MPLFTEPELAEFQRGFNRFLQIAQRMGRSFRNRREVLWFMLGLRASHIEESLMVGEHERTRAHFKKALDILRQL